MGVLFAISASLYAASVPNAVAGGGLPPAAAMADAGDHGGCHGSDPSEPAPAHHPAGKTTCCDIACHAWLAVPTVVLPPPPPAATMPATPVAAFQTRPGAGIDRPPRA